MNQTVFVIMPISGVETAPDKLKMVQEIAQNHNWSTHLPEYDPKAPIFNLNETMRDMQSSDLVLADLTGERPSCYFELGLAEALRLPVFAIAEQGSQIHQTSIRGDVKNYQGLEEFRQLVEQALAI